MSDATRKGKARAATKARGKAKRKGTGKSTGNSRGKSTGEAAAEAKAPAESTGSAKAARRRGAQRATPVTRNVAATTKRAAPRARRVDVLLKGLTVAAEPPIDANPGSLDPVFRNKLQAALARLAAAGTPFRLVEGFRTRARQQWLYGSGRPTVVPFGRPGPIPTNADGVDKLSLHQGNGTPGSGRAADCYPTREGRVFIPPSSNLVWEAYADAVEAQGLIAGRRFPTFEDSSHCELR